MWEGSAFKTATVLSVAAAAILKLHSRTPTASAPHPWLSSSLRALAEVLSHTLRFFLPWALESGTRCVGGGPAKISLSGSYHQSDILGDTEVGRSLCPLVLDPQGL